MRAISHKPIEKYMSNVYLFALMLYLFKAGMNTTMYTSYWPQWYDVMVRVLAVVSLLARIFCERLYDDEKFIFVLITSGIFLCSYANVGYDFLLGLAILLPGAMNLDYRRIVRVGVYTGMVTVTLALLGSTVGCITNLTYEIRNEVRNSMGFVYPTDCAARIFFLCTLCLVYFTEVPLIVHSIAYGLLAAVVYKITLGRCGTMGLLMLSGLAFCFQILQWIERKKKLPEMKPLETIFVLLMPIEACIMLGLSWWYNPENIFLKKLNEILSTRLTLGNSAMKTYGLTVLGTAFEQIGSGGGQGYRSDYNFVDSSYVLLAVRYGILVLIIVCILYMGAALKTVRSRNMRLAAVLIAIATVSMIEHHLIELAYNTLLLLGMTQITAEKKAEEKVRWGYRGIVFLAMTAFWIYLIPMLQAISSMNHWSEAANQGRIIMCFLFLFLLLLGGRHIILHWRMSRIKKWLITAIGICLIIVFVAVNRRMADADAYYEKQLQQNEAFMNLLSEQEDIGAIYVDGTSAVYHKQYPAVRSLYFPKELLAYTSGNTLITDSWNDLQPLFLKGYCYTEVSDDIAVYTNDVKVVDKLEKAGYSFTDYCSKVKDVTDIMKEYNEAAVDEEGQVILTSDTPLEHGPYVSFNKGTYRITYVFELLETYDMEEDILMLRITWNNGLNEWKQKNYSKADFDEQGLLTAEFDVGAWDRFSGIEFKAYCNQGTSIRIKQIYYQRLS